jgi:hypothetical protein
LSITEEQTLWTSCHSLVPENPSVGIFTHDTIKYGIKLSLDQQNWLMMNVPSPSHTNDLVWLIKSLILSYRISNNHAGGIDKIEIRGGPNQVALLDGLRIKVTNDFNSLVLELPSPAIFRYGLGLLIHVTGLIDDGQEVPNEPPTSIEFASIGLHFVKKESL